MTHDEFVEKECRFCGSQRCYGVEFCNKYKVNVRGEEDDITDEECEEIAEEVHENLIHSLIEAGGTVREARELLTRSLEMLYLLGYDSGLTNDEIKTLTTDIKQFLEDTE